MSETEVTAEEDATSAKRKAARKMWLGRLALVLVVLGVIWAIWYVLVARNHVSTDNAYVNAQMAQVTPLIPGAAFEILVKDTQQVKRGDILIRLDQANARIAVTQADAELAAARRRFRQTLANNSVFAAQIESSTASLAQAHAQFRMGQAEYEKARIDLRRREALIEGGAVSGEEISTAQKNYATARAVLDSAQSAISQAGSSRRIAQSQFSANDTLVRGLTEDSDPAVLAAKARLEAAQLDLDRTLLRAPIDGIVSRLQVQIGQRLNAGQTIMIIVPLNRLYVDANFKEVQLRRVRVGMPVTMTSDLYGSSVTYHGTIAGFAGGTGSSMAIIPAQNATGNWIKVVQRLPVRIELDPAELREHPLRVGLSMEVEIDVSGG